MDIDGEELTITNKGDNQSFTVNYRGEQKQFQGSTAEDVFIFMPAPFVAELMGMELYQDPEGFYLMGKDLSFFKGKFDTYWASNGTNEWMIADLGKSVPLAYMGASWKEGAARRERFDVYVSDDAQTWRKIYGGHTVTERLAVRKRPVVKDGAVEIHCGGYLFSLCIPGAEPEIQEMEYLSHQEQLERCWFVDFVLHTGDRSLSARIEIKAQPEIKEAEDLC